jgi:hypothetical protein
MQLIRSAYLPLRAGAGKGVYVIVALCKEFTRYGCRPMTHKPYVNSVR